MITDKDIARQEEIVAEAAFNQYVALNGLEGLDGLSLKKLKKKIKKVAKKAVKVIKKVAPVALGVAAAVFAGPAALGVLKAAAPALLKGAASVMGSRQQKIVQEVAAENPQAAAALQNQPIEIVMQSPLVQEAANRLTAQQSAAQGVAIQSPQAEQLARMNVQQASEQIAGEVTAPKVGIGTIAAIGVPVAIALLSR